MDPHHIPLVSPHPWTYRFSHPGVLEEVIQRCGSSRPPSCHRPLREDKRRKGIRCPFSLLWTSPAAGVGVFKGGLRELPPKAGIRETWGIGYMDQSHLHSLHWDRLVQEVFIDYSYGLLPSTGQLVGRAGRDTVRPLFSWPVLLLGTGTTEAFPSLSEDDG